MPGRPASRLATNAKAVRNAALSEPISRAIRPSMCCERRASPRWTRTSRFPTPMTICPLSGLFRATGA
eukprot:5906454-Pyramimonas_sp.AAC.1